MLAKICYGYLCVKEIINSLHMLAKICYGYLCVKKIINSLHMLAKIGYGYLCVKEIITNATIILNSFTKPNCVFLTLDRVRDTTDKWKRLK